MNVQPSIAAMLGARRAARRVNPELIDWAKDRWDRWLRLQRDERLTSAVPRVIAVARLTCLEDLWLHVGLMELLDLRQIRTFVMLSLPTEGMARLSQAQARRNGWHELVHILPASDCDDVLRRLAKDERLAIFSLPAELPKDALACLTDPATGAPGSENCFIGVAADYSAASDIAFDHVVDGLRRIVGLDRRRLKDEAGDLPVVSPERADCDIPIQPLRGRGGRVTVPSSGQELVVASVAATSAPAIFVRQYTGIHEAAGRIQIRVPGALLTTEPQRIRLETRGDDNRNRSAELALHVAPSRLKAWMLSAFLNRGGAGNPVIRAFSEGTGCRIAYAEDEDETLRDIPVVWGVLRGSNRILTQAKAQGLYFFYIDHAYFDRGHGKSYRISRNRFEAGPVRHCPPDRLDKLGLSVLPWRKGGREIIVCPPTDYFMAAHGCADWLETTLAALRGATDRPIIVREKPQPGERSMPLQAALETAHALVTHSSNVAIEAACLGTPVFVSPASAAAPIGKTVLTEIETPVYPDRQPWLQHLAYNQFSLDEIRTGDAWRLLLDLEQRDFA